MTWPSRLDQSVQFIEYQFFEAFSKVPHLQRFLDWKECIALAYSGLYANAKDVLDYSLVERATKIQSLSISVSAISSEARLFFHMYEIFPPSYVGKRREPKLLSKMITSAQCTRTPIE